MKMNISAQLAAGDVVGDATFSGAGSADHNVGDLRTNQRSGYDSEQRHITFDLVPRADCIRPSADALLDDCV